MSEYSLTVSVSGTRRQQRLPRADCLLCADIVLRFTLLLVTESRVTF